MFQVTYSQWFHPPHTPVARNAPKPLTYEWGSRQPSRVHEPLKRLFTLQHLGFGFYCQFKASETRLLLPRRLQVRTLRTRRH